MPEEETQPQQIANLSITPAPDLSCAIVAFDFMGVYQVAIKLPSKAVQNFILQWAKMQRDILDQQRVIEQVKRSKIHA